MRHFLHIVNVFYLRGTMEFCGFGIYLVHYLFVGPANMLVNAHQVPQPLVIQSSAIVAFLATWWGVLLLRKLIKGTWFIPNLENETDYSKRMLDASLFAPYYKK